MKIKLTKIKELEDALNPHNIEEGFEKTFEIPDDFFRIPTIGNRFWASTWWSSGVQEIIDNNTFKTYSSIYRWEIID